MIFDEKQFIGLLKNQEEILEQVQTLTEEIEGGLVGKSSYKINKWEAKKSKLMVRMNENSQALRSLVPTWNGLSEVKRKNLLDSTFNGVLSSIEEKTLKIQKGSQPNTNRKPVKPGQLSQRINLAR